MHGLEPLEDGADHPAPRSEISGAKPMRAARRVSRAHTFRRPSPTGFGLIRFFGAAGERGDVGAGRYRSGPLAARTGLTITKTGPSSGSRQARAKAQASCQCSGSATNPQLTEILFVLLYRGRWLLRAAASQQVYFGQPQAGCQSLAGAFSRSTGMALGAHSRDYGAPGQ